MNWTGGHLSRTSHGGAKVSLNRRQKEHFAKVKNNLRNDTQKRSPVKWSIFGKVYVQQATHKRQSSIEPRGDREPREPVTHGGSRRFENQESHTSSHEPQKGREYTSGQFKREQAREDCRDLYRAEPQPAKTRKRNSAQESGVHDEELNFISTKRRRLLEKEDWVGIAYQRPLEMTFTSPEQGGNVGKRKKVAGGHRASYTSRHSALLSPFVTRNRHFSPHKFDSSSRRGKTDVRIHIGDRIVPPGISSSTAPSKRAHQNSTPRRTRDYSQVPSSDVMLLDSNGDPKIVLSQAINEISGVQGGRLDQHERSLYRPLEGSEDEQFLEGEEHNEFYQTCDRIAQRNEEEEELYDDDDDESGESRHIPDEIARPSNSDDRHTDYLNYPAKGYTFVQTGFSRVASERSKFPVLGTPFSPSLIQHPMPQSSRVSSILHSITSHAADSTIAQVGNIKPIIPSSQDLNNDIWETWMSFSDNDIVEASGKAAVAIVEQEQPISPGVSTLTARRIKRSNLNLYTKQIEEAEAEGSDEIKRVSRMVNPSAQKSPSTGTHKGCEMSTRKIQGHLEGIVEVVARGKCRSKKVRESNNSNQHVEAAAQHQIRPSGHLPKSRTTLSCHPQMQDQSKEKNNEDLDEIWRQFVFGSDEAIASDDVPTLPQPLRNTRRSLVTLPKQETPPQEISATSPRDNESHNQNAVCHYYSGSGYQACAASSLREADISLADIAWDSPKGVSNGITKDQHKHTLHSFDYPASISETWLTAPQPRPTVVFTRPKRFKGSKGTTQARPTHEQHLHIGDGLIGKASRHQERNIYSLADSDEIQDD